MLAYHPYSGQIISCDFAAFKSPEITKVRPVLVISPRPERHHAGTVIVAALSTTPPSVIKSWHMEIELQGIFPIHLQQRCWLKGDMVYAVGLHRLHLFWIQKDNRGKRVWWNGRIDKDQLLKARKCVAAAIGLHLDR